MKEALLYFNPVAGRQAISRARLSRVRELLFAQGIHCTAVASRPPSEGVPELDLEGKQLLIAMGGDGTIHEVLPAAVRNSIPLGILPTGTANVLATELGIPAQIERAIRTLSGGHPEWISLGRADKILFHLMAGIGVDGGVIRRTSLKLKRSLGELAYWLAGFRTFFEMRLDPFQLEIDGEIHQGTFAVISNCRLYGGKLEITPGGSPFSGVLDLCLFQGRSRFDFPRYLLGILLGRHTRFRDVLYLKAQKIALTAPPEVPVQLDGDLVAPRPECFEVQKHAIQIVTPLRGEQARQAKGHKESKGSK